MKTNKNNKKTEESEHRLFEVIAQIRDAAEAQQFFEDLCTPAERQVMADRWEVVEPLKAGKSYREIYDDTGVSITTIGRVARCINLGTDGYNLIYKRVTKNAKKKTQNSTAKKGPPK